MQRSAHGWFRAGTRSKRPLGAAAGRWARPLGRWRSPVSAPAWPRWGRAPPAHRHGFERRRPRGGRLRDHRGHESGVDAAYHLSCCERRVGLLDRERPWKAESSDPTMALSTHSLERMREKAPRRAGRAASADPGPWRWTTVRRSSRPRTLGGFGTKTTPLLAGVFGGSQRPVADPCGDPSPDRRCLVEGLGRRVDASRERCASVLSTPDGGAAGVRPVLRPHLPPDHEVLQAPAPRRPGAVRERPSTGRTAGWAPTLTGTNRGAPLERHRRLQRPFPGPAIARPHDPRLLP
jgi:hypothetical protein